MDALAALLDGPRAQRAFLLKAVFAGRWSIGIEDGAPLTVVVMAAGRATYIGSGPVREVRSGDVVLVRGPHPYVFADSPETPTEIRILPGQVCVDPHGQLLGATLDLGVRTWGNARPTEDGATVMLIGTYAHETSVGARLLASLPCELILRDAPGVLVEILAAELTRDGDGQVAVLDRLLDLVLVTCLRQASADLDGPGWPAALDDPVIGPPLRLIHQQPDQPWTVASLAGRAGMSRAAFARRFSERVGEPPLTYLTGWRLALAADLLIAGDLTLAAIARRVGYGSAFALSAAFKREYGMSPSGYRDAKGSPGRADDRQPDPEHDRGRARGTIPA